MGALGNHILVEFMGCIPEIMNDVSVIEEAMVNAADIAGATVINSTFHHFSPYGVSGVVVIQESHLAIHTWPEYGYAAVDLFTCGEMDAWISFDHLKTVFGAQNYSAIEMKRGSLNLLNRVDFDMASIREEAKSHINPDKFTRNVWFTDKDDNQALSLRHTGEVYFDKSSDIQRVKVIDTYAYGKTLTIDNMFMCTETDEAHYHEMISHPVMSTHQNVKNVLVIGGGDGGTIREIFKYKSVEAITMVEIDNNVVEASKEFLPQLAKEFGNPKLDLRIEDGIAFVNNAADKTYDLVIVDGSDPVGPAKGLFSTEFYSNTKRILKDDGILVTQGESPLFNRPTFIELNTTLKEIFGKEKVNTLLFHIPTYPSGTWSFQIARKADTDITHAKEDFLNSQVDTKALKYYNPAVHNAAFALPNYIREFLNEL
jgi:spermidine synthase